MLDDSCKIIWHFLCICSFFQRGCSSQAFCLGERDCHWWVPSIMKVDTLICSYRRASYLEGCIFYKNNFSLPSLIPLDSTHHCPARSIKPSANHTFLKNLSTIRRLYLLSLVFISSHSPPISRQYGSSACLKWPKQERKAEVITYPLSSSLLILVISLLYRKPNPMDLTLI